MKNLLIIAALVFVTVSSCRKPETLDVKSNSPYKFNFLLDGNGYSLKATSYQYMTIGTHEVGAYFPANAESFVPSATYPVLGLVYSWPVGHKVTEADLMGLSKKNLNFGDNSVRPEIIFKPSATSLETWTSIDTGFFAVTLNSIKFLKRDTIGGTPLKCYNVSGATTTVLWYNTRFQTFNNAEFDMVLLMHE
jgi:hypothetical protein